MEMGVLTVSHVDSSSSASMDGLECTRAHSKLFFSLTFVCSSGSEIRYMCRWCRMETNEMHERNREREKKN